MKILDLSFSTPAEDLACDEALLDESEAFGTFQILRFWQPKEYFVVLGYSSEWKKEVSDGVRLPVLRRCSGGGTVLQGPGCLNYSLLLRIKPGGTNHDIHSTNAYVMGQNRKALEMLLNKEVRVQGHTDLTLGPLKFSGNSQRRRRKYLLFHGTFLLHFDLKKMDTALKMPEKQPAYRHNRPHSSFVTNLNIAPEKVKKALAEAWHANGKLDGAPENRIEKLVKEKYSQEDWNLKF